MALILLRDYEQINPKRDASGKYSPNLYRYMRSRAKYVVDTVVCKDDAGILFIGDFDVDGGGNGWFSGCTLNAVLCDGPKARSFACNASRFSVLDEFWADYIHNGRCAIDRRHIVSFIGDDARWHVSADGKMRRCNWCCNHVEQLFSVCSTTVERVWRPVGFSPELSTSNGGREDA